MAAYLIYDDACGLCDAGTARLAALARGRVTAIGSRTPEALALLPGLARDDFERRMYLVCRGRAYGGAEAIARTLALNPWLCAALLYYAPGLREVCDTAYLWIAARRHALGESCGLPGAR